MEFVAQLEECRFVDPDVAGSRPVKLPLASIVQLVEQLLRNERVAGPIPA